MPGASETGRIVDLLGDGTPVILPAGADFAAWWELKRRPKTTGGFTPEWIRHDLPRELAGHGLGAGDINGDGRMDIIGRLGWAEAPKDPRKERWTWHPDFDLEQASIPILVVDVDGAVAAATDEHGLGAGQGVAAAHARATGVDVDQAGLAAHLRHAS